MRLVSLARELFSLWLQRNAGRFLAELGQPMIYATISVQNSLRLLAAIAFCGVAASDGGRQSRRH
jgi:hypothetical protein